MMFGLTSEQTMLRESVRKLHQRCAPPSYIRGLEAQGAYPYELYQAWAEAGLFAIAFPERYGGAGGSMRDLALIVYEIGYCSIDFQMAYGASVFCGLNILHKGSEAQRERWLPQLIAGERRFGVCISEPEAGSDAGAIRTRAERDGDMLVLNGQKVWSTGVGARDATLSVYARTNLAAPPREGLSLVLVDNDATGVLTRKLDMLGRRCTGTYEVFFTDVRVAADRVVGGLDQGWGCLLSGLRVERVVSAAGACGAAQAAVDLASGYAKERKQFGRAIGSNQAIAHMLADMQTETAAASALLWQAAGLIDDGGDAFRELSMAKLKASENYAAVANMGMQIAGGMGYSREFAMERHYRDARASTIAAGTSQIQRNLIAGQMGHKIV